MRAYPLVTERTAQTVSQFQTSHHLIEIRFQRDPMQREDSSSSFSKLRHPGKWSRIQGVEATDGVDDGEGEGLGGEDEDGEGIGEVDEDGERMGDKDEEAEGLAEGDEEGEDTSAGISGHFALDSTLFRGLHLHAHLFLIVTFPSGVEQQTGLRFFLPQERHFSTTSPW
ncbi:hypothetical protein FGB62_278g04 [Gracilaria domingensis]|nr:hypothetical protein FGB62_278g04 [Gracilaria domingensis]